MLLTFIVAIYYNFRANQYDLLHKFLEIQILVVENNLYKPYTAMLKQLKISNFRIFDSEVTVRFRPITILIGKNNAGKTSIIKFLLMLQQTLIYDMGQFLVPNGHIVELGLFENLKNSNSKRKSLRFSLNISGPETPENHLVQHINNLNRRKNIGDFSLDELSITSEATVSYASNQQFGRGSNTKFVVWCGKPSNKVLEKSEWLKSGTNYLSFTDSISDEFHMKTDSTSKRIFEENVARFFAGVECVKHISSEIQSLKHLLPIRKQPRVSDAILDYSPQENYVGNSGEFTLPHLKSTFKKNGNERKFVEKYLQSVLSVGNVDFDDSSVLLTEFYAENIETGNVTLLANFGFGVSQCLPIFVQGAIMPRYSTLMIEQPESQVHPTAQMEIGSYIADLWNTRKVGTIIETHSSNLILRLRKLIAYEKLKPEDVSIAYFDVSDGNVTIDNIDIDSDGRIIEGMPMEFFGADITEGLELRTAKYNRS